MSVEQVRELLATLDDDEAAIVLVDFLKREWRTEVGAPRNGAALTIRWLALGRAVAEIERYLSGGSYGAGFKGVMLIDRKREQMVSILKMVFAVARANMPDEEI